MYQLLQALDVAVMKELLLEIRFPGAGLGGGTLRRCHRDIASCGHLELTVNTWCKLYPCPVWVGAGAETTSQESSHSQISVAETVRISDEPKGIRRGLIIESIPWIQRKPLMGRAEEGLPLNPRNAFYYQTTPDSFGFIANPYGFGYRDLGMGTFLRSGFGSGPNPNRTWIQFAPSVDGQFQVATTRNVPMTPPRCPTTAASTWEPYFQKEFF